MKKKKDIETKQDITSLINEVKKTEKKVTIQKVTPYYMR